MVFVKPAAHLDVLLLQELEEVEDARDCLRSKVTNSLKPFPSQAFNFAPLQLFMKKIESVFEVDMLLQVLRSLKP